MVERSRITLLTGALASIALPYLSACAQGTYEARPLPPPRGVSFCGPTPSFYDYYYYPQDEVYFHIHSGDYFYWDGGVWWRVRLLPAYFILDPGDRVCLRIMDEQPWRYHYAIRAQYPPRPRFYSYYDYWYYPYWGIYFQISTGWYYYYHDHRWHRTRRLPRHIRLDDRHRHKLHIPDRKPWLHHDEHRWRYPPPPDRRPEDMPPVREPPPDRRPQRPEWPEGDRQQPERPGRPEPDYRPREQREWPARPEQPPRTEQPGQPRRPTPDYRRPRQPEPPPQPAPPKPPEPPPQPAPPERPDRDDREPPARDDGKDKSPPIWWPHGRE